MYNIKSKYNQYCGGNYDETYKDTAKTVHQRIFVFGLRRVPGILPVRVQDVLHGCESEVRKRK
jgi:hypothetical protein